MKDLEKILEYQEIDIKLRRVLDIIDRSDEHKRIEQAKAEFNQAKLLVTECEKEAEVFLEFYNEAEKYYEINNKRLDELEQVIENCSDEEYLPALIEQLEKLKNKMSDLDRKLQERRQRAEKILKRYKDVNERGRKLKDIHTNAKAKLDNLKKEKEDDIRSLTNQLDALKPGIDSELLQTYSGLTQEGKYPAVVEAYEDSGNFSCRGCGLTLSQKAKSMLSEDGICRCETCRRIIYKKMAKAKSKK